MTKAKHSRIWTFCILLVQVIWSAFSPTQVLCIGSGHVEVEWNGSLSCHRESSVSVPSAARETPCCEACADYAIDPCGLTSRTGERPGPCARHSRPVVETTTLAGLASSPAFPGDPSPRPVLLISVTVQRLC